MPKEGNRGVSTEHHPSDAEQIRPTIVERQHRARRMGVERFTLIAFVILIFLLSLYVLLYLQKEIRLIWVDAVGIALAVVCLTVARWLNRRDQVDAVGYLVLLAAFFFWAGGELVWDDGTIQHAIAGIVFILFTGIIALPRRWGAWFVAAGLYLAYLSLVNQLQPLRRVDYVPQLLALRIFVAFIIMLLVAPSLWRLARVHLRIDTIRARLLVAFVAMVLLPSVILTAAVAVGGLPRIQQQAANQLRSVAILKEIEIAAWVDDLQFDLILALTGDELVRSALVLLERPEDSSTAELADSVVRARLEHVIEQTGRYEEMLLLDRQGNVLLSTDPEHEGGVRNNQGYFRQGLQGSYVQRPYYSPTTMHTSVFASRPVKDNRGVVLGVLVGRANLGKLNEIMAERTGLGETGETYLVDATSTLLTPTRFGEVRVWVGTEGTTLAVRKHTNGVGTYDNYRGIPVLGAYRWFPELQLALLAEQEQAEAFRPIYTTFAIVAPVGLLGVLLAIGVSLLITRSIATPLTGLAHTAKQIAAGDLTQVAQVDREDEIGTLAQAFNAMTAQLRDLIGTLEQRVAERTKELEQRSAYLEAAAQVGSAASSILEAEPLIQQVVDLIRERFDLYYVGLFLVDETGKWAVLRAGTGAAGQAMLARGHRLQIDGQSMIGWSIANAQARIALEAGEDAVRLATPELPDTRSEAALPLHSRGQIIGALTVQHVKPGAFDQDIIVLLQTMADQVAVALDNARLFTERQQALESAQRAYGELSRQAWNEILRTQPRLGYRSDERGVTEAEDLWQPEMEQALRAGTTIQGDGADTAGKQTLAVPIKIRGEVIGVLDTCKPVEAGDWTSEEIELLEAIAEQLDVALESARLYQDMQRRAAREQAIRQVTEQMRRAVDVEAILQSTVAELARAMGAPQAYVRLGTEAELQPAGAQDRQVSLPAESSGNGEGGQDHLGTGKSDHPPGQKGDADTAKAD